MKPTTDEIRALLFRFYEGETTHEEEQRLISYFTTETEIPADLEEDALFFKSIDVEDQDAFLDDVRRVIQESFAAEDNDYYLKH